MDGSEQTLEEVTRERDVCLRHFGQVDVGIYNLTSRIDKLHARIGKCMEEMASCMRELDRIKEKVGAVNTPAN